MIRQKQTYHKDTFIQKTYTEYFNNELVIHEEYDEQGRLTYEKTPTKEISYKDAKPHGPFKELTEDCITIGQYHEGKRIGHWTFAHDGDFKILRDYHYINGLFDGTQKIFHGNGQLALIIHYANGEKTGRQIEYYPDGKTKDEKKYLRDALHGPHKTYDSLGQQLTETLYVHGQIQETPIIYHYP